MDIYNMMLGFVVGLMIAVIASAVMFLRSNDYGDDEGTFEDFSKSGLMIYHQSTSDRIYNSSKF